MEGQQKNENSIIKCFLKMRRVSGLGKEALREGLINKNV